MNATNDEVWDMFVAHGTTAREVARLSIEQIRTQVSGLRQSESDNLPFSDEEIAAMIYYKAHADIGETV